MLDSKLLQALGGWEGYVVERVQWPQGDSRTVSIYLKPQASVMHCERCGAQCCQVHETTTWRVRDLVLFEYRVVLHVPRRRLWCDSCGGPHLEKLSWLVRYQRVTDRLAQACSQLLRSSSIKAVAAFFDLGWHTVKSIDKALLLANTAQPQWDQIEYLAMDEFALHKGHRYATVVVDPISRQVLWVGQGRSRETARQFFEQLPAGVAQRIRAVAIDMTTAYELEIKAHCPNAEIVYDLFHVVAKYGREVIDRVRVDQANLLRQQPSARKVLKSSRWLLLRNRNKLQPQQAVQLKELLAANQPLMTVYVLRDELKQLWFYRRATWAHRAWRHWCDQAHQSGIAALSTFAQRLQSYLHGIIARCRHPLNTSVVEGINNTIKVIKRRAYGYRDQDYFFLKIRAAFPGNAR
ncbi:ISL3 family transposase [Comamonas testosteroni]|uniref:ISL3 family transposase n=1 Tax=Comamonas testosteroni TaxID=285 RepID=UPI00265F9F57|nr:ISL3 family transposase [Comamonas testosteroni]WKL15544.1 ISL3 family transposase [Comamonas testosteroni]WKL16025.1 ISL3 family transposase [Comamonas testosteroni]